jgi:thioredoxin-related protein
MLLKRLLPLFFLLVLAGTAGAETRNPDAHFFDQTFGDLKADLDNARKSGKKGALVMFEMEGCPYCKAMREHVLNQSEVQDYYRKHFVIFSIDVKGDTELTDFSGKRATEKEFATQFRVKVTPVFQFFDLDGKPAATHVGIAKGGVKEFLALGRYVAEGAYEDGSFAQYKRKNKID